MFMDSEIEIVRNARRAISAEFGHDVRRLGEYYIKLQEEIKKPNKALHSTGIKRAAKAASLAPVTGRAKARPVTGLRASE
jgi:hypothetical protein